MIRLKEVLGIDWEFIMKGKQLYIGNHTKDEYHL